MDNGWFRTLTRDDVTLNASGAAEVRAHSVVGGDGREHEVDVLILATGFDVVRFLAPMDIVGRSGRAIRTTWEDDDAKAYLGTVVPDLPNFFCLYGPNLQAGHGGSLLNTIEVQVRYIVHLLQAMFEQGLGSVECRQDVHDAYNDRVDAGPPPHGLDPPRDVDLLPQHARAASSSTAPGATSTSGTSPATPTSPSTRPNPGGSPSALTAQPIETVAPRSGPNDRAEVCSGRPRSGCQATLRPPVRSEHEQATSCGSSRTGWGCRGRRP